MVVTRGYNLSRTYLHTSALLRNAKHPSDEDATIKKQDDSNAGLRLTHIIYLITLDHFFSADDPITTYLSSKYKILSEENAPIILDLEAERKRLDELDISQVEEQTNNTRFEDNHFADIDLTRKIYKKFPQIIFNLRNHLLFMIPTIFLFANLIQSVLLNNQMSLS